MTAGCSLSVKLHWQGVGCRVFDSEVMCPSAPPLRRLEVRASSAFPRVLTEHVQLLSQSRAFWPSCSLQSRFQVLSNPSVLRHTISCMRRLGVFESGLKFKFMPLSAPGRAVSTA
jgi:hypothetical protein